MTQATLNTDISDLKARFVGLLAFEAVAGGLAVAFLVGYFAFHAAWCLPAFAVVLVGAVAAQVRFILAFRRVGPHDMSPSDIGKDA
jgi:hypothetical protein